MLEYDRIDISEGTDINKTNAPKESKICHYQYFKHIGFKYEPYLCNDYHGLMQKTISFTDVFLKKIRIKRENIEETDIIICLKKRNKD